MSLPTSRVLYFADKVIESCALMLKYTMLLFLVIQCIPQVRDNGSSFVKSFIKKLNIINKKSLPIYFLRETMSQWFFISEIQQLMACLLYSKVGIEHSPYASLLDPVHWLDICDVFAKEACALLGLSLESPLEVCITAGCVALPSLLQIKQVMQKRQVTGVWCQKDELPVSCILFDFVPWFYSKQCLFEPINYLHGIICHLGVVNGELHIV